MDRALNSSFISACIYSFPHATKLHFLHSTGLEIRWITTYSWEFLSPSELAAQMPASAFCLTRLHIHLKNFNWSWYWLFWNTLNHSLYSKSSQVPRPYGYTCQLIKKCEMIVSACLLLFSYMFYLSELEFRC